MTWTIRGAAGAMVLALGLGTGIAGLGAAGANAATNSPPVPKDDHVTLMSDGFTEVNVLANDTDPDGDQLAVCRLGKVPHALEAEPDPESGRLMLMSDGPVGTFTFTYYACDFESLVPATITVKVTPRPPMHVKVVKPFHHPGTIKVVNGSGFWVDFAFGNYKANKPDGIVHLAPHSSRMLHTRRPSLIWVAVNERYDSVRVGIVRGIRLPEGVKALPPGAPTKGSQSSQSSSGSVTIVGRAVNRTALRWALAAR